MNDALLIDRLQFTFTITYHYLFPQLTMGLALLIVIIKWKAYKTGEAFYDNAARFWIRIFAISFAVGVIGQTLAMEGVFSFFLESTFLGLLIMGEKRLSRKGHLISAVLVFM